MSERTQRGRFLRLAELLSENYPSVPYDPNIANVFYLAGFIESWDRGVEKICEALKADNLPMPEYTVHPGDVMIKFAGSEDRIVRVTDKVANGVTVSRKTVAVYLKSLKEKGFIKRVGTTKSGYWEINS